MDILQESASYNQEISYGKNVDTYDQYFYNLLAMVSMYCGTAGCLIAIQNQGNMSAMRRPQECITDPQIKRHYRRTCSKYPVSFSLYFNLFCLYYLVLRIPLNTRLPFALLAIFIGCTTGMTMGFFIGAIGNMSENVKTGLVMVITMGGSFLSG